MNARKSSGTRNDGMTRIPGSRPRSLRTRVVLQPPRAPGTARGRYQAGAPLSRQPRNDRAGTAAIVGYDRRMRSVAVVAICVAAIAVLAWRATAQTPIA